MKALVSLLGEYIRWLAVVAFSMVLLLCASGFLHREDGIGIRVMLYPETNIRTMDLEDYVLGAVSAEVPTSFALEALKAQAVAARTYACKAILSGKHEDFDICTDSACCQAFQPVKQWKTDGDAVQEDKIRKAVRETAGQVIVFQNRLIEAAFFSSSGGKTEDAADVWGWDYPYLKSTISPGEERAPHYAEEFHISKAKIQEVFSIQQESDIVIDSIRYTNGGGIASLTLSGEEISGTQFRKQLSLPSTRLQIEKEGDGYRITSYGFGHRVGMSQYGAQAMALQGKDYRSIIAYYYPGTSIQIINSALFS